jgi:FimV-like protein
MEATIEQLSSALNLDEKDLAALAARLREERQQPDSSIVDTATSLDDLAAEIGTEQVDAAADVASEPELAPVSAPAIPAPAWWTQTWVKIIAGLALLGAIGWLVFYLMKRSAEQDLAETVFADPVVKDRGETREPTLTQADVDDDLSSLTTDAESILRLLEDEEVDELGDDESIYATREPEHQDVVLEDGTEITAVEMEQEELDELIRSSRAAAASKAEADQSSEAGNDAETESVAPEDEDQMEVKLDLAKAYVTMQDPDGAKAVLEVVLEQGNEKQKKLAQEMLERL